MTSDDINYQGKVFHCCLFENTHTHHASHLWETHPTPGSVCVCMCVCAQPRVSVSKSLTVWVGWVFAS